MVNLKPCPFCGGKPKVYACDGAGMYYTEPGTVDVLWGRKLTHKLIECYKCGVRTKAYLTDRGVSKAWNRRVGDGNG